MDLQKTKEARRRDAPGKQEEGSECPLKPYNGNGHSKDSPKADSLSRGSETRNTKEPANQGHRQQKDEFYSQTAHQSSPAPAPSSSITPQCGHPLSSKAIRIPAALGLSPKETNLLITANRYPPVTKSTLSELDLPCIMGNINLRMDANFDRDLHFKPDLDGEKGRKKRKDAADYWEAMAAEIKVYAFCASCGLDNKPDKYHDEGSSFEPRLPAMFETLQDVLKTLVPERDHPNIMQNLEVPLLMQQIQKGVLDMVGIATWLAALLKTHCAPMRDEWADSMVNQITSGSQSQNTTEIVGGLKTLFAILEAMKLDVANHQIRAFRVLLIEDTIPFLQEYFRSKIERGDVQVESSRLWYLDLRERELRRMKSPAQTDSFWPLALLLKGLSELLLHFHSPDGFPDTFDFDADRLWQTRGWLQNTINLEICWYIFESYIHSQRRYLPTPTQTYATFRSRIGTLLEETEDCIRGSSRWLKNVRYIALEIARLASECCGDATISDDIIAPIEASLEWHLSNEHGLFQHFQGSCREKLLEATFNTAKRYLNMSPLAICESQRNPARTPDQNYDIDRIATRLAHIGVLHWRVWAPMLYVRECMPSTAESIFPPETELTYDRLPFYSGTKTVLIEGLEQGLMLWREQHGETLSKGNGEPENTGLTKVNGDGDGHEKHRELRILSIDMGIRNLAFAVLNPSRGMGKAAQGLDGEGEGDSDGDGDDAGAVQVSLEAWRRVSLPLDRGLSVEEFSRYLDYPYSAFPSTMALASPPKPDIESYDINEADINEAASSTASPTGKGAKEDRSPFSLPIYATHAHSIVSALLARYKPTHVLIERQRFRSGGGSAVQEWSLRVGVFEGMLWATLHSLRMNQDQSQNQAEQHTAAPKVISIEPARVGRFWAPPTSSPSGCGVRAPAAAGSDKGKLKEKKNTSDSRQGKKLKIDLVGSWLERDIFLTGHGPTVQLWIDAYMSKWKKTPKSRQRTKSKIRKKAKSTDSDSSSDCGTRADASTVEPGIDLAKLDDMADCLVQGVTWLEWEGMKEKIVREGIGGVV
ncbi:T-complex protein 11-domain-containing protein [Aspergillus spinulosporus]